MRPGRDTIRSMWQEMDEMRTELEHMLRQASLGGNLISPGGITDRMVPAIRGEFRVDVRDDGDDTIVVADLPGIDKEDVSLQLLNPRELEISGQHNIEADREAKGYYVRERLAGTMRRIVALPTDVLEEGGKANYKNGVLEVRLRKTKSPQKSRIEIE